MSKDPAETASLWNLFETTQRYVAVLTGNDREARAFGFGALSQEDARLAVGQRAAEQPDVAEPSTSPATGQPAVGGATMCAVCKTRPVIDRRLVRSHQDGHLYRRGPQPKYCEECRAARDRDLANARQRKHRNKVKEMQQPATDVLAEIAKAHQDGTRRLTT
jgi:hypothetical protein